MRIPFLNPKTVPTIEVMCVAYKRYGPLKVLVQCFLNQTAPNSRLNVIHDGADSRFEEVMAGSPRRRPIRFATTARSNATTITGIRSGEWE